MIWKFVFVVQIIAKRDKFGSKMEFWHFNEGNITFCVLNDAP